MPIVCTGNDFSTLYAPLIRDGRMEKVRSVGQIGWTTCLLGWTWQRNVPVQRKRVCCCCEPELRVAHRCPAPSFPGAVLLEPHPRGPHRRVHGHLPGALCLPCWDFFLWVGSCKSSLLAGGVQCQGCHAPVPSPACAACADPSSLPAHPAALLSPQHDNVNRADVETLVDAFPGQSIDFFGALRARVYDDKVRRGLAGLGIKWEGGGAQSSGCVSGGCAVAIHACNV